MKRSSSSIIIKHPPQKGKRTNRDTKHQKGKEERKKKEGKTGTL